jgi:hypothetical protein
MQQQLDHFYDEVLWSATANTSLAYHDLIFTAAHDPSTLGVAAQALHLWFQRGFHGGQWTSLTPLYQLLLVWEGLAYERFLSMRASSSSSSSTDDDDHNDHDESSAIWAHQVACDAIAALIMGPVGWTEVTPLLAFLYKNERKPLNPWSLFHYLLLQHVVPRMRLDADALYTGNLVDVSRLAYALPKERRAPSAESKDLVYFIAPAFVGVAKCAGGKGMRRYLKHYRQFVGACKQATVKGAAPQVETVANEEEPQANEEDLEDLEDKDAFHVEVDAVEEVEPRTGGGSLFSRLNCWLFGNK